jgi:hypothetical protein
MTLHLHGVENQKFGIREFTDSGFSMCGFGSHMVLIVSHVPESIWWLLNLFLTNLSMHLHHNVYLFCPARGGNVDCRIVHNGSESSFLHCGLKSTVGEPES